jgi:hypothetical protein
VTENITHSIDQSRLAHGRYNHEKERDEGEGDISASYSGDTIAQQGRIRKPFRFEGNLYATIGTGNKSATAYRLVPVAMFDGPTTTYAEQARDHEAMEAARNSPNGGYHGLVVKSGKDSFVMCGPPVSFVAEETPERPTVRPEEPMQLNLF